MDVNFELANQCRSVRRLAYRSTTLAACPAYPVGVFAASAQEAT